MFSSTVILTRLSQSINTSPVYVSPVYALPILVTVLGMSMEIRPSQPRNAKSSISVKFVHDDKSMAVRLVQPSNAPMFIVVTVLGTEYDVLVFPIGY